MTITQYENNTESQVINQHQQPQQQQPQQKNANKTLCFLRHQHKPTTNLKRQNILSDGISNLHIILDFDHTLTSYLDNNGNVTLECHDMMYHGPLCQPPTPNNCHYYKPSFHSEITALENERKTGTLPPGQVEWWQRFHDSMLHHKVTHQDLKTAVQHSNTILRPGAMEILNWTRRWNVPTTIVSAGITSIIVEFLKRHGLFFENITIVANEPIFGKNGDDGNDEEDGVIVGWKEPLIYSRNKAYVLKTLGFGNEAVVKNENNEKDNVEENQNPAAVASEKNVVLAGNSIGDSKCLDGVNYKHSLSFGFLHAEVIEEMEDCRYRKGGGSNDRYDDETNEITLMEKTLKRELTLTKEGDKELEKFLQHYDVVSCGYDTDFQYLLSLFKEMEMNEK